MKFDIEMCTNPLTMYEKLLTKLMKFDHKLCTDALTSVDHDRMLKTGPCEDFDRDSMNTQRKRAKCDLQKAPLID